LKVAISTFTYPKALAPLLTDIHFLIKAGGTLGIVGKTGTGKTTLLKLLLREYDNYQGQITLGSHNIKNYALNALLCAIGYVPQDHFLFSMSVADNIRFADPSFFSRKSCSSG